MRSIIRTNSPSAPPRRIARSADVQASTLVRFAQTLGFGGFSDLQEVFRSRLRNRWPDYSERLRALHGSARDSGDPTNLLIGFANSAAASIARLREGVSPARSRQRDRSPRATEDDLLSRPAARLQRRPLPDLRPRPARPIRLPDRQCRRTGAGAARPRRARRRPDRDQLLPLFARHRRPRQARAPGRRPRPSSSPTARFPRSRASPTSASRSSKATSVRFARSPPPSAWR